MKLIEKITGLIELMRIPHLTFSVPIAIAAMFMATNGMPEIMTVTLVALATGFNHIGGHVMNDFFDKEMDSKNPRTMERAIPSGRVKPLEALIFALFSFIFAFILSYSLNIICFIIAIIGAIIALLYSSQLKQRNIWGNISCGFVTAMPVFFGWLAVKQPTSATYILFIIVFFWEIGHNILAAATDYTYDEKINVNTLPVKIGMKNSSIIVLLCYFSSIPLALIFKPFLPPFEFIILFILSWLLAFLGALFVIDSSEKKAKSLFIFSSLFLPFLSILLVI